MNYQQEWADDFDEEFDLAETSGPKNGDPEEAVEGETVVEGGTVEEADPADVAEQLIEVPIDEDDETPG